MKVKIDAELELTADECRILRQIFDCDEAELGDRLAPYINAAAHEYVDMFTGNGPIGSMVDTRERRLVSIIRYGSKSVPSASLVTRLFKLPLSSASTLIRNVSAKHDDKIGAVVRSEARRLVEQAKPDEKNGRPRVIIQDGGFARYLNDILRQSDTALTPVKLMDGSANRYEMDVSTRTYLLKALK